MDLVGHRARGYTAGVSSFLHDLAAGSSNAQAAAPAPQVGLVADDETLAAPWCEALRREGIAIELAPRGAAAGSELKAVVLHCAQRLPERLGLLRELRAADPARALLVVCRGLRELEQVLALEMGADDVIDAGLSAPVVAARLRALWRRGGPGRAADADHLAFGRLSLHLRERRVQFAGECIGLTECEFEVLWLLALQAGRAVSRAELLERLRGLPYQRIDRSIDCRIHRIRAKLRDGEGATQRIRTVRNCGYLFSPACW
jgi:two-component system OmpR family response regulator